MSPLPPRFPITSDQIDQVVGVFYARIRRHPELGPIFNRHIGTEPALWRAHEAKIARFWRNAILFERSYDGNPMQAHMRARDVRGEHFALWLGLFDAVLADTLPPETARAWSQLAHRIGRGLRMGVEEFRKPDTRKPDARKPDACKPDTAVPILR